MSDSTSTAGKKSLGTQYDFPILKTKGIQVTGPEKQSVGTQYEIPILMKKSIHVEFEVTTTAECTGNLIACLTDILICIYIL